VSQSSFPPVSDDNELKRYFPELDAPDGLTLADLESAEQMVFDWEEGRDFRALTLVVRLYEHLKAAARAHATESR
jgi:hypothetical protein